MQHAPSMGMLPLPPVLKTLPAPPPRPGLRQPSMALSGSMSELPPLEVQVGEIHGQACTPSVEVIRAAFPVECRLNMRAQVSCNEPGVTVHEIRGNGGHVEVLLGLDSRRSMDEPFRVLIEGGGRKVHCEGRVVIDRPAPYILGMQTVCGGQTSADCPVFEEFWQKKEFKAYFEPKIKEIWISPSHGVIEAGAKVFPFKVFFAPQDTRPIEALLVVDFGDKEITVKVCGSTGGFQGRRWGERRH